MPGRRGADLGFVARVEVLDAVEVAVERPQPQRTVPGPGGDEESHSFAPMSVLSSLAGDCCADLCGVGRVEVLDAVAVSVRGHPLRTRRFTNRGQKRDAFAVEAVGCSLASNGDPDFSSIRSVEVIWGAVVSIHGNTDTAGVYTTTTTAAPATTTAGGDYCLREKFLV